MTNCGWFLTRNLSILFWSWFVFKSIPMYYGVNYGVMSSTLNGLTNMSHVMKCNASGWQNLAWKWFSLGLKTKTRFHIFLSNLPILLATCINNTSYTLASWGKVDLLWIKKSYMYCIVYVYLDIHNLALFVLGKWQVINPPGKTSEGNEHLPGTEHTCKFTLIDHIEMCPLHLLAQKIKEFL